VWVRVAVGVTDGVRVRVTDGVGVQVGGTVGGGRLRGKSTKISWRYSGWLSLLAILMNAWPSTWFIMYPVCCQV
jgi:hypothetical protein